MSESIKKETKREETPNQSFVFSCPSNKSFTKRHLINDSKCDQMNSEIYYYFNGLLQEFVFRSVSTTDLLTSVETKLIECNNKSMEAILRSNEKMENYLKLRENHFLNKLKNTEKQVDDKLNSIATDVKNAVQKLQTIDSKLDSISVELRERLQTIDEKLKDLKTPLLAIDSNLRNNSMTAKSVSNEQPFHREHHKRQFFQSKPFWEPMANKLSEDLRLVIKECFKDLKTTIIDAKIMEMIGEKEDKSFHSNTYSDSIDNNSNETDLWLNSMLLRNGETDVESLRSKALNLLNESKITQSFTIAVNLCEPEFVCNLCTAFQNCPQKLFTELKKSKDCQKLFIDILDQLFSDGVIDGSKRWKIPLIAGLVLRIDMKQNICKLSVPRLADHWFALMEEVAHIGGQYSQEAKLLAISLKHISNQFY